MVTREETSREILLPAPSSHPFIKAVPYLAPFSTTFPTTGQATAHNVPPIAAPQATSHIVASVHFSRSGCAAPNQAPTKAPHFSADILCTALPSGATDRATSGKYVPALNAVESLNSSLFCSVIPLTSSPKPACPAVAISRTLPPYLSTVSRLPARKLVTPSHAFFHNGRVSGDDSLFSFTSFAASSALSQASRILIKACPSS